MTEIVPSSCSLSLPHKHSLSTPTSNSGTSTPDHNNSSRKHVKRVKVDHNNNDDESSIVPANARVLIVDDVHSSRKMVRRILSSTFHDIDDAEDGLQALEKYKKFVGIYQPYNVIMMDFMMPVMNGLESTTLIKSHALSANQGVVIVGVTGNGLESDVSAFYEAGADFVLIKPLNLSVFLGFLSQRNRA